MSGKARTDLTALPQGAVAFLLHFARRRPWKVAAVGATLVAASSSAVTTQYALKMLIDAMTSMAHPAARGAWPAGLMLGLGLLLGFMLVEGLAFRLAGWLGSNLVIGLGIDIRAELFARLASRPWRFFHDHQSGALAGRIGAAGQSATSAVGTLIWNVVPPSADLVGSIIVLTAIDWQLAAALIAAAVVFTALLHRWGGRGFEVHQAYYRESAGVMGNLGEVLANIMLVKSFGATAREAARLQAGLQREGRLHGRSWMFLERLRLAHDLAFWAIAAVLLLLAVRLWRNGTMTPGDVVVVMTLSLRVVNGSRELALALLGFTRQLGAVQEAVDLLVDRTEQRQPGRPLVLGEGRIAFRDVWFSPDGRTKLFRGLNLEIPPGQTVGVVGASGAGKSTLLRLLQGLVAVERGEVAIDGQAITAITEASLAETLAVVTQEVELLHRTLRENIVYGAPEAAQAEIDSAIRAAGCEAFIGAIPEGLNAIVGERGVTLSGGQRQRLALARALLKRSPILLLDEATSALDTASELAVQSALLERAAGRTVIAVAHRLSTIMGFDRVIVLRHGEIVEDGNPRLLRSGHGAFAQMWAAQSRVAELERAAVA